MVGSTPARHASVLCHTISTTTWRNLFFNETCVGEFGINAAVRTLQLSWWS
jgi:D-aminopeptidase